LRLALLLFLIRKRKKPGEKEEPEHTTCDDASRSVIDDDGYISEYGLSDGVQAVDDADDQEDLPQAGPELGDYRSDVENMSEHNPEELGDEGIDPDET
jgi:hypothetical protein